MSDKITDTCDHCGLNYNPNREGHSHDECCQCYLCDINHEDYDPEVSACIHAHVDKHGCLDFCGPECESGWIRGNL